MMLKIRNFVKVGALTVMSAAVVLFGCGDDGGEDIVACGEYNSATHFCDARDNQLYRYVEIGPQVWMAENLNYNATGSWCYDNDSANCDTYGRLYDWITAITVCPAGWHLPSDAEWQALVDYVGDESTAGTKLKSSTSWEHRDDISIGTDDYGFSALPGGYRLNDDNFWGVGEGGIWWAAMESVATAARSWFMYYYDESAHSDWFNKRGGHSVRCVRD